jgi:catechol 2,3-dioxygenase-like lactoylglutathione lyase family enzyme
MQPRYKNIIAFLWAEDFAKAITFYTDVLGLKKVYESDGWCELSVPGTRNAYLAVNRWTRDGKAPRNDFITFGIEGIDEYQEHLAANNVRLKGEMIELDQQGLKMLKFYDPEGNVITLAEVQL